jgi:MFS family permease
MALVSRIYFNAVFGGLGALFGWMLFGILGDANPSSQRAFLMFTHEDTNLFLGGALIGGMIGYFVVGVDALRDQSVVRFARLASYGVALGTVGGALGMWLGDIANVALQQAFGARFIVPLIARGIGWSLLGVAIGASEGIAARSLGKLSYGTLGGALGGFIGGALFELFYGVARNSLSTSYLGGALGLVILGACIGALSALVQAVFQPASVRVLRGWQEGREYPLDKLATILGRAEDADIALFRDMKVEKRHAVIRREGERYILVNNGAPVDDTRLNEAPISSRRDLADGDRIQLGNVILRFQARAAVERKGRRAGAKR